MSSVPASARVGAGLPLALSARKGDRHYDPRAQALTIDVLIDGTVLDQVVSYDIVAGTIVRLQRDESGRAIVRRGQLVDEVLHGQVEVRWTRAAAGGPACPSGRR